MTRVAGIDEFGEFNEKNLTDLVEDLKIFWRLFHGPDVGLDEGDPDLQIIESVAPEIRTLWAGMMGAWLQAFVRTATGAGLDKAVEILNMERKLAVKATGSVTFSRTTGAPSGGVTIPAGTIVETADGIQFSTKAAATIVFGQTSVTVAVTAVLAGAKGNVSSGTITTIVSSVAGVDSVTNSIATANGADKETDSALRARALLNSALRGRATANAIRARLLDVSGVTTANVLVNNDDDTTADVKTFDSDKTGTASEQVRTSASEEIAFKFSVPAEGAWVQDVKYRVAHVGGAPTVTVRIETDASGSPSGVLATSHHLKTGETPPNGSDHITHFERPGFLAQGTYWVRIKPTVISFTLDGGTGGTADQVKFFNGSTWVLSTTIENPNAEVLSGIPPHSVQSYVQGGADADIGAALLDAVAAGIRPWGAVSVSVEDDSGTSQTMRFSRPTEVTIYVDVTITTNTEWDTTNGPDAVRDAIVEYIGGVDTKSVRHSGLALGADVIRNEVIAAIMGVPGVSDVTVLKLGKVNPPTSTTGNLDIDRFELARAETASGIDVTVA